jgi:TRAP-type C4-dicarboxylate transport system permease small subunit
MTRKTPLQHAERALVLANQTAIVAMMAAMAALVFVNVVTRYGFGVSLNWSEEIARYLMVWVTYVGAGLAMREGMHVALEYLQGLLPRRWTRIARGGLWAIILTVAGVQFSHFAWNQRSPVMGWRMGMVYLAIPVGSLLFALHLVLIVSSFVQKDLNADELAADALRAAGGAPGGGTEPLP